MVELAREAGIPESTLQDWLQEEPKLHQFLDKVDTEGRIQRKRAWTAKDPVLDKAVFNWLFRQQSEGFPISGRLVQSQAQGLSETLHVEITFYIPKGWLHQWKRHHNIHQVKNSREVHSADVEAAKAFQVLLEEQGYSLSKSTMPIRQPCSSLPPVQGRSVN